MAWTKLRLLHLITTWTLFAFILLTSHFLPTYSDPNAESILCRVSRYQAVFPSSATVIVSSACNIYMYQYYGKAPYGEHLICLPMGVAVGSVVALIEVLW